MDKEYKIQKGFDIMVEWKGGKCLQEALNENPE